MKVTIKKIYRDQRQGRNGPFESVSLYTVEHASKKLSGYGDDVNKDWKEGDVVELGEVYEKNGFMNFKMLGKSIMKTGGVDKTDLMALSQKMDAIIQSQKMIIDHLSGQKKIEPVQYTDRAYYPKEEIDADNIPF